MEKRDQKGEREEDNLFSCKIMITLSQFAWKPFSEKQLAAIRKRLSTINVGDKPSRGGKYNYLRPKAEAARGVLWDMKSGGLSPLEAASMNMEEALKTPNPVTRQGLVEGLERQKEALTKKAPKATPKGMSDKKKAALLAGGLLGTGAIMYGAKKLMDKRRKERSDKGKKRGKYRV